MPQNYTCQHGGAASLGRLAPRRRLLAAHRLLSLEERSTAAWEIFMFEPFLKAYYHKYLESKGSLAETLPSLYVLYLQ